MKPIIAATGETNNCGAVRGARGAVASMLLSLCFFAGCGGRDETPEAAKARQYTEARQRIIDTYENGRSAYAEIVEKRLRERWPAGSGHEEEFARARDEALRYYERMLQGELNQLEQSVVPKAPGELEILRKPPPDKPPGKED